MADYFDVEAILAEEERVSVHFNVGSTGLGRALDPSCDDDNLSKGSDVELPFWLVRDLATRGFVSLHRPKFFSLKVKNDLQADARCVSLGEKCPYFYELGLNILSMTNEQKLADFIMSTFERRYQQLLIQALSVQPDTQQLTQIQRVLTREEDAVFDAGRAAKAAMQRWSSIKTPNMLMVPARMKGAKRRYAQHAAGKRVLQPRNQ